jgi:hypothetical protein
LKYRFRPVPIVKIKILVNQSIYPGRKEKLAATSEDSKARKRPVFFPFMVRMIETI